MKIKKLPSGSYNVQKQIDGKRYSLTYNHEPTKKEIEKDVAKLRDRISVDKRISFKMAAGSYIGMKEHVLSPSTLRDYNRMTGRLSDRFNMLKIDDITQTDIQIEINRLATEKAPKTVNNIHAFISAVLKTFRPDMVIRTTLPQKVKYEPYTPSTDDIKKLLKATEGTKYEIPFKLGCLGLRRSEVCALNKSDLNGNILTINKALVQDPEDKFIQKTTKTTESTREIYIPDDLAKLILTSDEIYAGYPNSLLKALHTYQDNLGIHRFRFHDLRHFYASYAHSLGMSDADIMASGGWKTDGVMKNVYRHSMEESKQKMQKKIATSIF